MMNLAASIGLGDINCLLPLLLAPCLPNDYHHIAAGGKVLAGRFLEDQHYPVEVPAWALTQDMIMSVQRFPKEGSP